ncbi:GGDEF domain-containing protein [Shewanella sp. SM20]|uniref:GGDEF domain-containing protein n=1 Tax=Shewanella sp. SM20 TaxID=2912792 RepID=UPI0021DA5DE6|nr:GGDEF domain-containing protein [Shewanella sp. SM20]MCU8094115.1 GGDEF domain-containing protein [Shewanella sp. SM20]
MNTFRWGENFITGLSEVDRQHYRLVEIINNLGKLQSENLMDIGYVDIIYNQLVDYAMLHFQEEEELMKNVKLDSRHVEHHIDMHNGFLNDISLMYSYISKENIEQIKNMLKFLINWLAYHILGQDKDMAKQIQAIQAGLSPVEAYEKLEQQRDSSTAPLLEALSGLLEQVSTQNRALKELNESLEQKVLLRTKELHMANKHLEELSFTDGLTGLPNRRHAMCYLSEIWDNSTRAEYPLVCMMVDADGFKEVNDIYGHDIGDKVLIELANTLRNAFRNDDVVCRLGGDEFFIILPKTSIAGGMHIAELARKAVTRLKVSTGGNPWRGSISIGVACKRPDMKCYEELIKEADRSLYFAKDVGKNCVRTVDNP